MRYLLTISILSCTLTVSSQYMFNRPVMEVMAGAGMPVLLGDIGTFGTGPALRAGFRYRFDQNFSISSGIHASYILGSDANSRNEARGLSFKTLLVEPAVQVEYFFFQEKRGFGRMGRLITVPRIRPYLFGGAGCVYFNPELEGKNLSDVTEDYSKLALVVTGGAGLIYSFSKEWLAAAELGGRYLAMDYLDGFSPSASRANDLYYTGTLCLIYRWESKPYRRR